MEEVATVTINGKDIKCYDMTHGFRMSIESGKVLDSFVNIVADGTDLSEDEINALRGSQLKILALKIMHLTYPDAYDEDGNLKTEELEALAEEADKKKV